MCGRGHRCHGGHKRRQLPIQLYPPPPPSTRTCSTLYLFICLFNALIQRSGPKTNKALAFSTRSKSVIGVYEVLLDLKN